MAKLNDVLARVTDRVREKSRKTREAYLKQMRAAASEGPHRSHVSCGNLAHAAAACGADEKRALAKGGGPNIAIVTAYNDMLSAHQPLGAYPDIIKETLGGVGATAQIAGGVPAMCDGVTQGQPGMDLSLFSRDVIAMAAAVSLSHNVFDGAMMLGVCDKIVPGLFIGAARFGHLPILFLPAGPMTSGISNDEKARVRQLYAEGKVGRDELLKAESESYHSPGTCTFYGTANSNQMMMEMMGLHIPGSAFVNPGTPLREAMVKETARRTAATTALGEDYIPFCDIIDERAIINAVIGLHATGGSTNHTIHLIAMARAAGIVIDWDDFSELSGVTPLLSRIYPNGSADVNHFHAAGGLGFIIRELIEAGLAHEDVMTAMGEGLSHYASEPHLEGGKLSWRAAPAQSGDEEVLRPVSDPVSKTGGLAVLDGDMGRAVIKVSAVKPERRVVEAPAIVFHSQQDLMDRFKAGELNRDFVAVVPFQGPKAVGMPELHRLTPPLGVLQDKGFKVALVTDGRMSGASGKVPAAIHVTPEALDGGAIGKIRDGDVILLDAEAGRLEVKTGGGKLAEREMTAPELAAERWGAGRELFAGMRGLVSGAEQGAMTFQLAEQVDADD
ncbi:phosphogluconate dehydratase [Hyphococcus luteus]|uniref:Phosphogluconate dehydratase n=2 Tax=Hyphococcus luteus TaxID=2058213 RepID=A0A2S7K3D0_9PROT|nr:phosphogluconate dehydratase [Marinicaulis flavus]PQA86997.1 phosphogluconate dehydratase [Marinicaulis flavus]